MTIENLFLGCFLQASVISMWTLMVVDWSSVVLAESGGRNSVILKM